MRQDSAWLLATAKVVTAALKGHQRGTALRIRNPHRSTVTDTDGWRVVIGDLGKGQPRLEIWLDRFTGHQKRKLWACFKSVSKKPIIEITGRVHRKLWPTKTLRSDDVVSKAVAKLRSRLPLTAFNSPILESYDSGYTYFGVYDPTFGDARRPQSRFVASAVAFFVDVARAMPGASADDELSDVFPQYENRQLVASHLRRERSRLLASECKRRDGYRCQVCSIDFEKVYGNLGREFAEAHHLRPLSTLRGKSRTSLDDLATVCANCHRMLHRMRGVRGDLSKLRALVRRRAGRSAGQKK
jgi:HNH endonuclease